jgi:hypothetical protein
VVLLLAWQLLQLPQEFRKRQRHEGQKDILTPSPASFLLHDGTGMGDVIKISEKQGNALLVEVRTLHLHFNVFFDSPYICVFICLQVSSKPRGTFSAWRLTVPSVQISYDFLFTYSFCLCSSGTDEGSC